MSGIQALREKRAAVAQQMKQLLNDTEGKKWEASHQEKYDAMVAEIDEIDGRIANIEKMLQVEASNEQRVGSKMAEFGISADHAQAAIEEEKKLLAAWARSGRDGLNEEARRLQAERYSHIVNVMSTGVGSEGGYTVAREVVRSISEAMAEYGGMRRVANILRTDSGAPMDYPTSDGTSEEGELIGENQPATGLDISFGTVPLLSYKFSSKIIAVPFELLQDSAVDIEAHLQGRIEQRLGRATNRYFTTGTGTGEPNGAVTAAAAGVVGATGQTTSVTFNDLSNLEHSVDPAYRGNASFMFHDTTLRELKKMKDAQNRPLWLAGHDVAEPDTIHGYRYVINQQMPQMAANAKSILFGDFSRYTIRDVMAMMLFRMTDSKFVEKGQVGFLAWMRSGGTLTDAGGAIKYYQNSAT